MRTGRPLSCEDCGRLQRLDGKVWPGTCWFENECPYEILADRELGPIFQATSYAVRTRRRVEYEPSKREWDETESTRGGIRFACWAAGVRKPKHRRRMIEWVNLAVKSMNEGRVFITEIEDAELKAAREAAERKAQEYIERQQEKERKRVARERRRAAREKREADARAQVAARAETGGRARDPSQG